MALYKCNNDIISVDVEEIAKTIAEALDDRVTDLEEGLSTEAIVRAEADQILEDKKADRTEVYTRTKLNALIPRIAFEQAKILLGYQGGYFEVLYEGYYTGYGEDDYYTIEYRQSIQENPTSVYFLINEDGTIEEQEGQSSSAEEIKMLYGIDDDTNDIHNSQKPVGFRIMDAPNAKDATAIIVADLRPEPEEGVTRDTVSYGYEGVVLLNREQITDAQKEEGKKQSDISFNDPVYLLNAYFKNKALNGDMKIINGGAINWGTIKSTEASKEGSRVTGGGILQLDLDNGNILSDKTDVIHLSEGTDISIYKDERNSTSAIDGKSKIDIIDDKTDSEGKTVPGYVKITKELGTETFGVKVTESSVKVINNSTNAATTEQIGSMQRNSFITGEWHFDQDTEKGILHIYRSKNS